jgi:NAD(P)-dependent dehydrogenase (short-subunit alcohol dehydrogenase family)
MRGHGGGCLVFMTSTSGLVGALGQANYAAAKLGMVGLMRSAAQDLRKFGVRAHAIAPFARTRMTQNIPTGNDPAQIARLERLQRCRPEDVAPLVQWLVSDAAKGLTGQVFAARAGEVTLFELPLPKGRIAPQGPWAASELGAAMVERWQSQWVPLRVTADLFGDLDV